MSDEYKEMRIDGIDDSMEIGEMTTREQYDDCVRQLTEAHARIDRFESAPKGWWHKEVEDLKQQLAEANHAHEFMSQQYTNSQRQLTAALAAIKSKDAALQSAISAHKYESGDLHDALAIQPDNAALKVWLGEPRSYLYKFNSEFGDGVFWSHRPTHNGNAALESIPLYSPKGMTK